MTSKYVKETRAPELPPRIRTWQSYRRQSGGDVRVRVWREREAIGYGPPILYLEFLDPEGEVRFHDELLWKIGLDDWLLSEGVRAEPASAEALRFSFRMRSKFEPLSNVWGDGYFNSLLVKVVTEGPYASDARLRAVLRGVHEYAPSPSERLRQNVDEVEAVFFSCGSELKSLRYVPEEADAIIVSALVTYLDDRYHRTDRRRLFGSRDGGPSPKKIAALKLAEVLEEVLRSHSGRTPSAYFFGAVQSIENGDDTSVDINWKIIDREIGSALPEGFAPTGIKDEIRTRLEKKLAAHDPEVVSEACELLAITPGGDADTYRRTWGKLPR